MMMTERLRTLISPQKDKLAEEISVNLCFSLWHDINEGIYETLTEIEHFK